MLLLVFSVTPFKIDQNKNQNLSIDKVQNLDKETRQDSGHRNFSSERYQTNEVDFNCGNTDEMEM